MNLINSATIEVKIKIYFLLLSFRWYKWCQKILENLRKEHKKARHIVHAYKYGNTAGKSDDKEPSGTAGLPLYNILEKNNLNNVMIVVVRYFGGIKLGAGPLTRAYNNAGVSALKKWSSDHFFNII